MSSFWPKKQQKNCKDFCHESLCSFHEASLKLFGTFCRLPYLIYYLLSPQEAPKSSQDATNISGQKSLQYFCCYFGWNDYTKRHFEINWPLGKNYYAWSRKILSEFFQPTGTYILGWKYYAWNGINSQLEFFRTWQNPANRNIQFFG